jgi:hypothetical protein
MNEPSWNDEGKSKLHQAERAVAGSLDKLEHAMETLTEKVAGSSQKIQHMVDLGSRQKEELLRLKETAETTLLPLYQQGKDLSGRLVSRVKADPRPFLFGAALLVGAALALTYLRGGKRVPAIPSKYQEDYWAA